MVKLRVTDTMRTLLPACQALQQCEEIEYKELKQTAKAAKVSLSALVKGSEFVFPARIPPAPEAPEPEFLQKLREKRLIREYSKMTANVSGSEHQSSYSEGVQSASFSATMLSLLFLSFLAGYFGGQLLGLGQYAVCATQCLVMGLVSLVCMLYLEVGMYILKTEKAAFTKKRQ